MLNSNSKAVCFGRPSKPNGDVTCGILHALEAVGQRALGLSHRRGSTGAGTAGFLWRGEERGVSQGTGLPMTFQWPGKATSHEDKFQL